MRTLKMLGVLCVLAALAAGCGSKACCPGKSADCCKAKKACAPGCEKPCCKGKDPAAAPPAGAMPSH